MAANRPPEHGFELTAEVRALMARHLDWWKRKGMLYSEAPYRPLQRLWLPLAGGGEAAEDMDLIPETVDLDRLAGDRLEPGPLGSHGDHLSGRAPYGTIPWVEAILGCRIRATIQGGSMRSKSFIRDWAEWEARGAQRHEGWFGALKRLTEMLVERSGGRYAVVQTLMRGPSDLAEAILGPELTSYSLYDSQRELRRFLEQVTEAFIEILYAQIDRVPRIEGGYVNAFGIWAPGTVARTQCDASAFLSPAQYAQWFLPYDERIANAVDYSMIHLHSGSLHTVDALLAIERPNGIEIAIDPEPSGPPITALVPVCRRILAVKPLLIDGKMTRAEARLLRDELPADGLFISAALAD